MVSLRSPRRGPFITAAAATRALALAALIALAVAAPVLGQGQGAPVFTPKLSLPLDCRPGISCWIAAHVDLDPGGGVADYACGGLGYDGHKGTDIAIRDRRAMAEGVAVLAAAPGIVKNWRDGMADTGVREAGRRRAIEGRECGNGVTIDHGMGWTTQYCHMRRGSVDVVTGQAVTAGQGIGLVGLSGKTSYPHLHFALSLKRKVVGPFAGLGPGGKPETRLSRRAARETGLRHAEAASAAQAGRGEAKAGRCGAGAGTLWRAEALAALPYRPVVIFNAGFAGSAPEVADVRAGRYRGGVLANDAKALVLWAELFGVAKGDRLRFRLIAPDGTAFADRLVVLEKRQARRFQYVGKKLGRASWPLGRYRGEVTVTRRGLAPSAATVARRELIVRRAKTP
ncbi:MAG: M23 family metallopeptidase [Proteobacteria bacterium]|nr:M23 family metallopeptidase [Pseudomonadota bacterium]